RTTNSACADGAKTQGGTITIWLIYTSDAQKNQCQQKTVLMRNPRSNRAMAHGKTIWNLQGMGGINGILG
ncbi:MAG: hypothetical protein PHY16_19375, partial [Methylobacter sp.]|nr:hypothetical protein [Methylobacter sp.]